MDARTKTRRSADARQAPQLICLGDAGSKERPCIPQTAMGTLATAPR